MATNQLGFRGRNDIKLSELPMRYHLTDSSNQNALEVRMAYSSVPHNFQNLVGQRFYRLVVLERAESAKGNTRWLCQCDCGNKIIVAGQHLKLGKTKSCKCLWETRTKHGATTHTTKSREYTAWIQAKARCFNPNHRGYKNWGGRGITMCEKWRDDFPAFRQDMGPCPEGYELDRHPNNDGNYEPGNCRWASHTENNRNKRDSLFLTCHGQTKPFMEWCEAVGLSHSTVWARLYVWNWPIEKALFSRGKRR